MNKQKEKLLKNLKIISDLSKRSSKKERETNTKSKILNDNCSFSNLEKPYKLQENFVKVQHHYSARKLHPHSCQPSYANLDELDLEDNKSQSYRKALALFRNKDKHTQVCPKEANQHQTETLSQQEGLKKQIQKITQVQDLNNRLKMKEKIRQFEINQEEKKLKIQNLQFLNNTLAKKLQEKTMELEIINKNIFPYIQNVNLLSTVLSKIKQSDSEEPNKKLTVNGSLESTLLNETAKVNEWLMKEGREKQKNHHKKTYVLKNQIDQLKDQNQLLKQKLKSKQSELISIHAEMKYLLENNTLKERLSMCEEELYAYKMKYRSNQEQNANLTYKVDEMKRKIKILTSLIGCAIIFDLKQKENQKKSITEFANKIDKYQNIAHNNLDDNGFFYLKFVQMLQSNKDTPPDELRSTVRSNVEIDFRKLYYPNYLVLVDEEKINSSSDHIIIKPMFFVKIRAILDAKYIDFRLNDKNAHDFADFVNSHLKNYSVLQNEKKLFPVSRQLSELQIKQLSKSFIQQLLDERIQDLPEVETFREFLFAKYQNDEIYFYLLCRHKFFQGSELQNYINSGDPSKLIRYDKAKRMVLRITEKFGRSIQNLICYHLNEKKMKKGQKEFIKIYYLLKILLEVYKKIKKRKIELFRDNFELLSKINHKCAISFANFNEIIKKNFDFVPRADVCHMYRTSLAVYESQKGATTFFECFYATCGSNLLLQELIRYDKQLELECINEQKLLSFGTESQKQSIKSTKGVFKYINSGKIIEKKRRSGCLNELWPDSVHILANQKLNKQYSELINNNQDKLRTKLETQSFLLKLLQCHLIKQNIHFGDPDSLEDIVDDSNASLIDFLNKVEKNKIQHENNINMASKKIGKFFKNKLYEFYNEMLQDVNHCIDDKRNRYLKKQTKYQRLVKEKNTIEF